MIALHIPYEPNRIVNKILWHAFYPILVITFLYFVYVYKRAFILHRLKENSQKEGRNKWWIKSIGIIIVLLFPAMLMIALQSCLGLSTYYLSVENFSRTVKVKKVDCFLSFHGQSHLELTVSDKNHNQYDIFFPYNMCRPHISRLEGHQIKLYGRGWKLGKVYDGFYYPSDVDIN